MIEKTSIDLRHSDGHLLPATSSYASEVFSYRSTKTHHTDQSKRNKKRRIVIHAQIHSSRTSTPTNRNLTTRTSTHSRRKLKKRKKCPTKVLPYNDSIHSQSCQIENSCQTPITNKASSRKQSIDGLREIIERTKKRKNLNQKRCCCYYPCSLWSLIFSLVIALVLGILLTILLMLFLPKSSTTTTIPLTETTSTITSITTMTTTTTTTRPFGALSKYAIVTASYFNPAAGTATAQGDGLVDRQPTGAAFLSNYPPQYVQLELPDLYNITTVCLLVAQTPNGATHHQLLVGPSMNSTQLVTDLNGTTYNNQWINLTYNPPLTDVRFLHLKTLSSPSWVAWIKFLVYGV